MSQSGAIVLAVTVGLCNCVVLDLGRNNRIEVNLPWLPFEGETRCYDELGCLNITRDWYHLIYRPLNVFPLPREVIDTRFVLYTRKNPLEGQTLRANADKTIQKSNFDAKKQTKFIVHGFIDTPLSSWVKEMRRELLKHSDWNVIVVDWAGGSLPLYTQATANTRLVGLEIAHFINHLKDKYGLKPKEVHIIGHSLGAHTAGYAGERVAGLGRITGLDPAEPYFQGMPAQVRLDPSDAQLVDVIHTDGSSIFLLESWIRNTQRPLPSVTLPSIGYGMSEPCGHVDFYPNNGKEQPGCDLGDTPPLPLTVIKEGIEEASRVLVACNHIRAIKLFTESINSHCPYVAHRCPSYQQFLQGRCFSCNENATGCAVMGLNVQKPNHAPAGSKYFVMTGKKEPYCRYHYRVTVDLAKPPKAESWVQGYMKVTLHSDNNIIRNLDLTPSGYEKFQHGTSRSFVVTHVDNIGPVRKVDLYWEYDMDVLQPRSICFLWCNDHLYVSTVKVEETKDIMARE
ncbi:pancreatic triacylglycerol lipase-like isoform X2 [Macrosteles quadrilineatus]|uniref:pancreatic triacylglycerol lipase-like isoform X2 n=1 Tax=Macrosteles quadrilineatus TaxID=74068 RepID=UPI0023E0B21E|nr:pancreatic triacylglycerol lipase-like isoform X2 [Macrosteles quadrilineatus]